MHGQMIDENNQPVVRVSRSYFHFEATAVLGRSTPDAAGRFELHGVNESQIQLLTLFRSLGTSALTTVRSI